jgi:hypothetical protein
MTDNWHSIDTAPQNATDIEALMPDGTVMVVHWAEDLSGEEQPPFRGWFTDRGRYYEQVDTPVGWREPETKPEVSDGSTAK